MTKPFLKLLNVDIKKQNFTANGVSIYVNNTTPSIVNIKYDIFISVDCVYSASNPI